MAFNITNAVRFDRVMSAVAAGTSDQTSSIIDTKGYDAVAFLAIMGDITASSALEWVIQHGDESDLSDAADTEATVSKTGQGTTDDNMIALVEAARPVKRYCRLKIVRTTANAAIDGVVGMLFNASEEPVTQSADVQSSVFKQSPATA